MIERVKKELSAAKRFTQPLDLKLAAKPRQHHGIHSSYAGSLCKYYRYLAALFLLLTRPSQSEEIKVATEHPFLTAAGKLELEADKLSEWLAQDRIYALCGYPKFIASLIGALPLSSSAGQRSSQDLLSLFSFALANIDREVGFFDSLGPRFNLDLQFVAPSKSKLQGGLVNPTTKAYVDLLIATGAEAGRNGGLEEALVLLWGMEKVSKSCSRSILPSGSSQAPSHRSTL